MDLRRREGESELQYIWRVGKYKTDGLIYESWPELTDMFNREFREDTPYQESAYRKPFTAANMYFENVFKDMVSKAIDFDEAMITQQREIEKEKVRLRDERSALSKIVRESARYEDTVEILCDAIKTVKVEPFVPYASPPVSFGTSGKDLLVLVSDMHIGANFSSPFGCYNSHIAKLRLAQYANKIVETQRFYNLENCHVVFLGDLINGDIHRTISITNKEDVSEQISTGVDLISSFLFSIAPAFKTVKVHNVDGNHSRVQKVSSDALRKERLDRLIPKFSEAALYKLAHESGWKINVEFHLNNAEPTIMECEIRGKRYVGVHGDFDDFSKNGIATLSMFISYTPYAVLFGHKHENASISPFGVKGVRCGCLNGVGDDYTVVHRFKGIPEQMMCICSESGIENMIPMEFTV